MKTRSTKMTVTFFDYAKNIKYNDIRKPFVCIFAFNINKFFIYRFCKEPSRKTVNIQMLLYCKYQKRYLTYTNDI